MSDGTGTTAYFYDELSRITSETKTFIGQTGSYSIGYSYQLGGALKEVKVPTDATRDILYAYNRAGVLTGISGGGYGSVSQYIQNRKVRAFGKVKQADYGNNLHLEQQYDTRQRVSVFNVRNQNQQDIMKIEYEYVSSGQIKRANNVLLDDFKRNFKYDQLGRLKSADTDSIPGVGMAYFQVADFDVWDNLLSRSMGIWAGSSNSYSANYFNTYSNNRNTLAQGNDSVSGGLPNEIWQYDAAGMPTQTGSQTHKYDASGRKIESLDTPPAPPTGQTGRIQLLIQQTFDGDGRTIKRHEYETFGGSGPRTETVYYLHSTVLGKVLAEINSSGQKQKEYVYDTSGEAIARREAGEVRWLQTAPIIGSSQETATNGGLIEQKEYDPFGGEIPVTTPGGGSSDWLYTGTYQTSGNPFDGNGGCTRNGFPIDCAEIARDVMFGDPRTMNDTCPSCGAGSGMWLTPEQIVRLGRLDEGASFDSWDWLGQSQTQKFSERPRNWGYSFAPLNASLGWSEKVDACNLMADMLDLTIRLGVLFNGGTDEFLNQSHEELDKFVTYIDKVFSGFYLGHPADTLSNRLDLTTRFGRGKLPDRIADGEFLGSTGFKEKYRDADGGDQTHHFAAFFSLGINQHAITREFHQFMEDNTPDEILGDAGYIFGHSLRQQRASQAINKPEDPKVRARRIHDLAENVRKKLCD